MPQHSHAPHVNLAPRRDRLLVEYEHDTYKLPRKLPDPTACPRCRAMFRDGRWCWGAPPADAKPTVCPACHRIADDYPAGYLSLGGPFAAEHREEILGIARNVEKRESREHPLKEFAILTGGVLLVVALAVGALAFFADALAQRIPFSYEAAVASAYEDSLPAANPARDQLQALADRLGPVMELPEGMAITVHVVEKDIVNAQATLGGHVIIYRGLLEALPHETLIRQLARQNLANSAG